MTAAILKISPAVAPDFLAPTDSATDLMRAILLERLASGRRALVCCWRRDADGRLTCVWERDVRLTPRR